MGTAVQELEAHLGRIDDVERALAVLDWDQSTYMPSGGAHARARQLATLGSLVHEMRVSPRTKDLLEAAARETDALATDHPDRALVRVTRRERDRAVRVPPELVTELKQHCAATYVTWTRARPKNDFAAVRPMLEKTLELSRRWSECFAPWEHPADPMIDEGDPGMTAGRLRTFFAELRAALVPLVEAAGRAPAPDDSFLHRTYPSAEQLAFGKRVVEALGYDFERGRQDLTHHPFMTRLSGGDVRITTRVRESDLCDALFGTIHECGHALYEQGVDPRFDGTPLGSGTSTGVHESQSRLWENLVGRSRAFWEHFFPLAREAFPSQLGDVDVDRFYRAINRVAPSLIRVEADELTYNLHVMIRFDVALAMLEGELAVKDLPDAWAARYESDLGVRPPDDRDGCMQDVHWYTEKIGGLFQGYTLGNVMSAQFYRAAERAVPELGARVRAGDFAPLRGWLTDNVYRHGSVYDPDDLVARATGSPLEIAPYVSYLREKYGALYPL
jgi:carboxypeptidase Taq